MMDQCVGDLFLDLVGEETNKHGLPPGFRFHPTDEELVTFYLVSKVFNGGFCGVDFLEVDLNRCEPWELPEVAKMGEKEWYFYSLRDRKYPTGLRTNRATGAGYWKATGKDREVRSAIAGGLVGMKKTLVFYRGRAPRGEKTKWVLHEYRLDGDFACRHASKEEWVICRIFLKSGVEKNTCNPKATYFQKPMIPSSNLMSHHVNPNSMPLAPFFDVVVDQINLQHHNQQCYFACQETNMDVDVVDFDDQSTPLPSELTNSRPISAIFLPSLGENNNPAPPEPNIFQEQIMTGGAHIWQNSSCFYDHADLFASTLGLAGSSLHIPLLPIGSSSSSFSMFAAESAPPSFS